MKGIFRFFEKRRSMFSKLILSIVMAALLLEALAPSAPLNLKSGSTSNSTSIHPMAPLPSGSYTYNVTFAESGLPDNSGILQMWTLNISESSGFNIYHVDSSNISVALINGSYSFKVSTSTGYYATPSKGTFDVNGANVLVNVKS